MSLLTAELRKVWGNRVFPMLLAVLVAANLLLLWMGTRPTANQPPAAAYRAVGADLAALGSDMAAKGDFLHGKLDEIESLLRLENYYRDLAYGNSVTLQYYREQNADLFDAWEQTYLNKAYTLYTDSLTMEYRLFTQLVNEYDTVAGYTDFLDSVQTKAGQLAGISIFQNDETGYDLKNIEVTAAVYAGLGETAIDYYPQKGLYTAISYAFTDLILLASMLVLALLLVRQERDSGLLSLVRSLPGGRLQTALAKLGAFALSLLAVLALLYGVNLAYCAATFGLGPLTRTIQERACPHALHDADHGRAVSAPLSAGQVGRSIRHGAVGHAGGADCPAGGCRMGGRPGRAARDVRHPRRDPGHQSAERHQVCKPRQSAADQRTFGKLPKSVLVWFSDRPAARRVDGGGCVWRGTGGWLLLGVCARATVVCRQARLSVGAAAQNPRHLYI